MGNDEIPLHGGNVSTGVVRVGQTVRRPSGPWTPAVHSLLDHLHAAGFTGAPKPLAIDDKDREVLSFVPPPDARWQVLIPANGSDIIAHHDLAPWNLVIGHPRWAFIDWDTAEPGTRLWDVAYALHGFVPLSADPRWSRADAAHRLRVFADAYGLDETQRHELIPLLATRIRSMATFLAAEAAAQRQPWTQLWNDGHGEAWQADADYIDRHTPDWEHALLS